jgi:hypothetical protein
MRPRSIVVCVSALALAAVLLSAPGAEASHPAAPMVICPQETGPTCCGPPIDVADVQPACCPTVTVQCGDRITISSSDNPASEGSKLELSGDLIDAPDSGKTMTLWQESAGAKSFTQSQTTTSGSGGSYSFTVAAGAIRTNTSWYVTGDGLQSTTLQQQMTARVTLSARASGRRYKLSGTVTPAQSGQLIHLQRRSDGKWLTFATVRLNRKSAFSFKTPAGRKRKTAVRAVFAGDSSNTESVSPTVRSPA